LKGSVGMSSHWLESLFWAAQVVLVFVAVCAAVAALVQIRTTKLFELLKYLESSELRKSRRVVFRDRENTKSGGLMRKRVSSLKQQLLTYAHHMIS
jgi:hypothetical protein